jgi:hypothetical protein
MLRIHGNVRFDVLVAIYIKIAIVCYATPCSLVDRYQCFGGKPAPLLRVEEHHFYIQYGGSSSLRNIYIYPTDYTASQL